LPADSPIENDSAESPSFGARFSRGDHVELAQRLVNVLRTQAPTEFVDGRFYQYEQQTGVFRMLESARLSRTVQAFAGTPTGEKKPKPLALRASDVTGALKLAADQAASPDFFASAKRGVAFADCFVEVEPSGIVRSAHSAANRARFAYPFGFKCDVAPAALLQFLADVFRDDADRHQKSLFLQEYLGVSLLGLAPKFQRVAVMVGEGANGKSVAGAIFERCMPTGSVCAIPPQDMGQEYRRAMLAGKLLNIVSELPESDILDSESWKAVVAGDTVTGRPIREAPFTFKPTAGHIYSANRLPGTSDQTHGFWRRLVVVPFNRVFQQHEQRPSLADDIVRAETPAIVAWAIAGAQRALAQGHYTLPTSATSALDDWRRAADQVRGFVDEKTERLPTGTPISHGTPAAELYAKYRVWAADNGHKPLSSPKFAERMKLLGLPSTPAKSARVHAVSLRKYPLAIHREERSYAD
jgi:putative DNA primase/helicase